VTAQAEQESFSFQAEVAQLLNLVAHSLYSNKEIFLRELVSNASDAIDRLRFERFSRDDLGEPEDEPWIRVSCDREARTVTIADNGIGMSRDEVKENIGTIAKSGTAEFLKALTGDQRRDAGLIGQFGVGFYSAFVVADQVTLTTRRAGLAADQGVRWESDGQGSYTLQAVERAERGTTIVLRLREGEDEFLADYRLRAIVHKYSDHVSVPILMASAGEEEGETAVNEASALWARPKSELTDEDYHRYYKHIASDFADPLAHLHAKVEGRYDYTLLLFIPAHAPFELWTRQARHGVRLHVQRVFILEDTGQLLPEYLRFVRGVIDSADLPLNVSREILQSSLAVEHIRTSAVKKVLKLLKDLAEAEPEKYAQFWKEFGGTLKEGIADDYTHREEIAGLLRFTSTVSTTQDADVSLRAYVERMKEGQDKIYYLLAPSPAAAATSPHLEAFRERDIEVLLLTDPVDHFMVTGMLQDFGGHRLESVTHGTPDFGDAEDEPQEQATDLVAKLKETLTGKAFDVRTTSRLTTSPACIVGSGPETELSLVQRMRGSGLPNQPVLEINPRHPLIERLGANQDDPLFADWAHVLYDQAVLTAGARIEDPGAFVTRLNDLLEALTGTA
jgi:molecular chaperone HtpG